MKVEVLMMSKTLPEWVEQEKRDSQVFMEYVAGKALVKMQEYRKKEELFLSKYKKDFG